MTKNTNKTKVNICAFRIGSALYHFWHEVDVEHRTTGANCIQ